MNLDTLHSLLGWCTLLNFAILLLWWLMFLVGRDWIYRLHTRWFRLSDEQFDAIHYGGIALYKIAIFLFNAIPWIALTIIR